MMEFAVTDPSSQLFTRTRSLTRFFGTCSVQIRSQLFSGLDISTIQKVLFDDMS
jgi:hypothetical protein